MRETILYSKLYQTMLTNVIPWDLITKIVNRKSRWALFAKCYNPQLFLLVIYFGNVNVKKIKKKQLFLRL